MVKIKPILYLSGETAFDSNGVGILNDAISCTVTEERNGGFELEMKYPMSGVHFNEIKQRSLITAKPASNRTSQPFRVYRITKPLNGVVTVYAQHISYDLSGITSEPFTSQSAADAMNQLQTNTVPANQFKMVTDKTTTAVMSNPIPRSVRSLLGGSDGSVLDVYGGEYEFDRFTVKLHQSRGQNNGVSIRYGKNLTDLKQDENCASVKTGVYPYWQGQDGELVTLPEKIIKAPGSYDFESISPLDLSMEWQEKPTVDQLRNKAQSYVKENNIGVPKVSLDVSFISLDQTDEYKDMALLERVNLCDTVNVVFPAMGVDATAKCVKTVYNVLLDRMEKITLGEARTNISDTVANQQNEIKNKPTVGQMQSAILSLTSALLGASGGAVRLLDTNNDGMPDTLYIADNPDPVKAVKVWRFNYEGWGASKTGYNGPYVMGATLNNGLVADFITAGTLNAAQVNVVNLVANSITSGILASSNKNLKINLDTGVLSCANGNTRIEITDGYFRLYENNVLFVQLRTDNGAYGGELTVYDKTGVKSKISATEWELGYNPNGPSKGILYVPKLQVGAKEGKWEWDGEKGKFFFVAE